MSHIIEKVKDAVGLGHDTVEMAGRKVHTTGYGLMGLTWKAQPQPAAESIATMKAALESGANLWNGGELYGTPERNSLHLLREYFAQYPGDADKVVICIKGGLKKGQLVPDGSMENTRRSIDECLAVMDNKKLDLWEAARVDPNTPIEITMRAANEYIKAGKLGGISLSECSADTIRRAAKEVKISAVEVELSLWETSIFTNGVAQACAELKIPIVAYSPLGRGFLTGQIKSLDDIPKDDIRRHLPRFQPEHFEQNLQLVHEIEKLATKKGCTPGQVATAWVKAQGRKPGNPVIVPIPGASSPGRVKENMVDVSLSSEELHEIDELLKSVQISGGRYGNAGGSLEFGNSPPLQE